jgi:hypothetical protein
MPFLYHHLVCVVHWIKETKGERAQVCRNGVLVQSYGRNPEKKILLAAQTLLYHTHTPTNILTSKGGGVLMAAKKAAAKKPAKKAAKKKK